MINSFNNEEPILAAVHNYLISVPFDLAFAFLYLLMPYFDLFLPILTYFATKLSMFCFEPSPTEEGPKPLKGREGPWEPEGPPSLLQELKGGVLSTLNF